MAKENNEISDLVKKCKILLLDIEGTTTSISFVKDKLFPYAETNVKSFLESQWENEDVKEAVAALRKQAAEDKEKSVEGLVDIPGEDAGKDEQIEGLVKNVQWQMSADRKVGPLKHLQGLIWKLGYDKGEIKGHVYDDVLPALELWISVEGQKVYIYSSGSVQAQKLLFNKSLAGDMLPLIEGHFDTAVGAKQEAASYAAIAEKVGCKAEEILFLTDIEKEAEAARCSGLQAALVSREGNAPLTAEATAAYPVLHSFEQLASTNKRKPDPQVEEVPAKVPKNDIQDDVKTASEMEPETVTANGSAKPTEVEAMETTGVIEKAAEPTMEVEEVPYATVVATKDEMAVEESMPTVVETEVATAEAIDVGEKDVPMEDVTVTNASTVDTIDKSPIVAAVKANSTEKAVVKDDTTDTAAVAKARIDKENVADVTGAAVDSAKAASETSNVSATKDEDSVTKPVDKVEAKTKMVDAATTTESAAFRIANAKLVDAATETTLIETEAEKLKTKEAPAEVKTIDAPIAIPQAKEMQSVKKTAVDAPATEAITAEAPILKSEDVKTNAETKNATSTLKAAETNNAYCEFKVRDTTLIVLKAEVPTLTTSEANAIVAKAKAEANLKEALISDESINDETEPEDEKPEKGKPGNGNGKPIEKPEEVAPEIAVPVTDKPDKNTTEVAVNVSEQEHSTEAPASEPVVEEVEEKTEQNETEKMETDAKVTEVEDGPKEPAGKIQEDAITETSVEVKDITDDQQSLSEVTDIIDDVVPIVEEPTHLEEMEELQNAGDVLEKECDEILSKVQDVTNLDYIPVKPLHTIAEEMETENIDSNDIVDRILDTEMELSMKPNDLDLNAVQGITEPKMDSDERIGKVEPGTEKSSEMPLVNDNTEEKIEVSKDDEMPVTEKINENKIEISDEKMETEDVGEGNSESKKKVETEVEVKSQEESTKPKEEISEPQESKKETEVPKVVEPTAKTNETKPECKETDNTPAAITQDIKENKVPQEAQNNEVTESKLNGKANGDAVVKLNGDTSKNDELKSRLTAENGKEKVNGSNGDSAVAEIGQGDNKVEAEIPDIKVKTVTTDETIEQPVEA